MHSYLSSTHPSTHTHTPPPARARAHTGAPRLLAEHSVLARIDGVRCSDSACTPGRASPTMPRPLRTPLRVRPRSAQSCRRQPALRLLPLAARSGCTGWRARPSRRQRRRAALASPHGPLPKLPRRRRPGNITWWVPREREEGKRNECRTRSQRCSAPTAWSRGGTGPGEGAASAWHMAESSGTWHY